MHEETTYLIYLGRREMTTTPARLFLCSTQISGFFETDPRPKRNCTKDLSQDFIVLGLLYEMKWNNISNLLLGGCVYHPDNAMHACLHDSLEYYSSRNKPVVARSSAC